MNSKSNFLMPLNSLKNVKAIYSNYFNNLIIFALNPF